MKYKKLVIFFLFCFTIAGLLTTIFRKLTPDTLNLARTPTSTSSSDVLSNTDNRPVIVVSGTNDGYANGGLVALASTDKPEIRVTTYNNTGGNAEVAVYRADEAALLDYLVHDEDDKQLQNEPDISRFQFITTLNYTVQPTSGSVNAQNLTLPLEDSGIWYIRIAFKETIQHSFLIRSRFGSLVREGNNELVFWNQNYATRRSIGGGTVRLYRLLNQKQLLATANFDADGISKTALQDNVDIAVVEAENDRAIVPINLTYLNSGSRWFEAFQAKKRNSKYFVFTDRPIYKPGDTVNFKAVIRDDDDAQYAIPAGVAEVKLFPGYSQQDPIFSRLIPISDAGTISGEYTLPEEAKTGYYQLSVMIPGSNTQSDMWWEGYDNSIGFQVEYYRKPEYTIDVTTPKVELITGDTTSFSINGSYFSGQPLAGQKIKYQIVSSDYNDYEYAVDRAVNISDNYRYGNWGGEKIIESTVELNSTGSVAITLETGKYPSKGTNRIFSIEAEFDDGTGNPAFARKNVLVYAGDYSFYRKDYSSYSGRLGQLYTLPLILTAHRITSVASRSLEVRIHREQWIPYQEQDKKYPSYRKEEEEITGQTLTSDANGNATFSFTPTKIGSYTFTVRSTDDRQNLIVKTFSAWISQEGQPVYTSQQQELLTILTDKAKYQPNDTVRINISSAIPDRDIFLSLSRGYMHRYQIVKLSGQTGVIDIPLQLGDQPNMYITASSFSDSGADFATQNISITTDNKKLTVRLTPDKPQYGPGETATVNIETTDTVGNPLSGEVAVWAVDKAIFELVADNRKDIFDTFWRERSNSTQGSHSLVGINVYAAEGGGCFAADTPILMADNSHKQISQVKSGDYIVTRKNENDTSLVKAVVKNTHSQTVDGYAIINGFLKVTLNHRLWINNSWQEVAKLEIGDTLSDSSGNPIFVESIEWQRGKFTVYNLEIEKFGTYFAGGIWAHNQKGDGGRSVFKDTAYWNPSVRTDANGRAQVRFQLPDNLTTWVFASVGATVDTIVGQTNTDLVVTKDVFVRPILPNILRVDDYLVVRALVHNFTGTAQTFTVDLQFDSGDVEQNTHEGVTVESNSLSEVEWKIHPSAVNEEAKIQISAKSATNPKLTDTVISRIPVRAFGFWQEKAEIADEPKSYTVKLAADSNLDKSSISLSLAPTLVATLPQAAEYLLNYPFGCVEQTTSRFVPLVIAQTYPEIFSSITQGKDIKEMIAKGVNRLASLQRGDGGWSWWGHGNSDMFVTAYVVEYLTKARDANFSVDSEVLMRARGYLENGVVVDPATGNSTTLTPENLAFKYYGLSWLNSDQNSTQLSVGELSIDALAIAVLREVRVGHQDKVQQGINRIKELVKTQGDGVYWETGPKSRFGSIETSTALAIRALTAAGERDLAASAVRFLAQNRKHQYWANSFATAQLLQALSDFSVVNQEIQPNYSYTISIDSKPFESGNITKATQQTTIVIPTKLINPEGSQVTISKSGTGQMYSILLMKEFHTDRNATAENLGLTVSRSFMNEKGDEYSLAIGDTVRVEVKIGGLTTEDYYGVIEDELPSGLIPINTSFKNEQFERTNTDYYTNYDVSDMEITENGAVLSLYKVAAGTRTYSYRARVISEGSFIVPPVRAQMMYAPEISGRSAAELIEIGKESVFTPKPKEYLEPESLSWINLFIQGIYAERYLLGLLGLGLLFLIGYLYKHPKRWQEIKEKIKQIVSRRKPPVNPPFTPTPPSPQSL